MKVHQERHHKEEIAKNGANAGIRGPADNEADTSPNSPKNSPKSIENGLEQRNSDEEEKIHMPNLTEGVENVKAEVKMPLNDPMGSLRQMGLPMPPTSQPMGSQPQRIPSFAPPNFPPTSLPAMTGFGLGGFGLPQPHFPSGLNPQLLAGLLSKPKVDTPPTQLPHFPLHMRAPESTTPDQQASITEIDQSEPEKVSPAVSEPMETAQS